jgi:integrase/recombinase XerD
VSFREHPAVTDFIAHLRLKNLSPRTIEEYRKVLGSLFKYVKLGDSSPGEVTTSQLRGYVASMQERGLAAKTVRDHVIVIKRFFGFLLAEDYIEEDPSLRIPRPKVGKRLPKALSITEVQTLLATFKDRTATERRDRVFFQLVYACGLRISEAVNIEVKDIDFDEGTLRVIGKGDKERRVYLKPNLLQTLREYIAKSKAETYLFPGRGGDKPITYRNMEDRFKDYVRAAGLPDRVTPHTLRHSIAVHYLINGAPITFVQGLLGHESLATTGIYTQLADTMTKEVALSIPTALDEVLPVEETTLRERMAVYEVGYGEWDALVAELVR